MYIGEQASWTVEQKDRAQHIYTPPPPPFLHTTQALSYILYFSFKYCTLLKVSYPHCNLTNIPTATRAHRTNALCATHMQVLQQASKRMSSCRSRKRCRRRWMEVDGQTDGRTDGRAQRTGMTTGVLPNIDRGGCLTTERNRVHTTRQNIYIVRQNR